MSNANGLFAQYNIKIDIEVHIMFFTKCQLRGSLPQRRIFISSNFVSYLCDMLPIKFMIYVRILAIFSRVQLKKVM